MAENLADAIVSIYYYERSYFSAPIETGIFPPVSYGSSLDLSPSFCLGLQWHNHEKQTKFSPIDDQQQCINVEATD
jgi:hypothetical protein